MRHGSRPCRDQSSRSYSTNYQSITAKQQLRINTVLFCLQVVLLDPVQYPGAMKAFAREVRRNDLLNFGRLHFFFPDSRMSLDLNTDKTLKVTYCSCTADCQCSLEQRYRTGMALSPVYCRHILLYGVLTVC